METVSGCWEDEAGILLRRTMHGQWSMDDAWKRGRPGERLLVTAGTRAAGVACVAGLCLPISYDVAGADGRDDKRVHRLRLHAASIGLGRAPTRTLVVADHGADGARLATASLHGCWTRTGRGRGLEVAGILIAGIMTREIQHHASLNTQIDPGQQPQQAWNWPSHGP